MKLWNLLFDRINKYISMADWGKKLERQIKVNVFKSLPVFSICFQFVKFPNYWHTLYYLGHKNMKKVTEIK
jgi:hypothetical protein